MELQSEHPIVLFDGVCNFCNSTVIFIIKRDKNNTFRFAHLQSETARSLLEKYQLDGKGVDSIIYIENDRVYIKSTAVLRILRYLKMPYPLLYALIIIPPFIRNAAYDFIAKNRYRWFGKHDNCIVPTDELKERFLKT
ncbi:MAG: thiol-disulfide oxidoreductase DCC family protein [Proteobacteria bacterium]|nr:thiol-disulfide oxidoreductase DCC family protein [Pseudomonadota bacterium]